jgi:dienelactone hydrolase
MRAGAMRFLVVMTVLAVGVSSVSAEVRTKVVEYSQGKTALEGYLAWDDTVKGPRPGVLVVHEWTGLGTYVESRAVQLAKLGYVAFCADIYGKGVRPSTPEAAGKTSTIYKNDRTLTRERVEAGLAQLRANPLVDQGRIAAIGYCFGGMVALELARSGANIAGVVVFHGDLSNPTPADDANIKCKVLALQGGDDPFVTQQDVESFESHMRAAGVNWQVNQYGGAVHSYTNPDSGNDKSKGVAYNAQADRRSWQAMKDFFAEIFS